MGFPCSLLSWMVTQLGENKFNSFFRLSIFPRIPLALFPKIENIFIEDFLLPLPRLVFFIICVCCFIVESETFPFAKLVESSKGLAEVAKERSETEGFAVKNSAVPEL